MKKGILAALALLTAGALLLSACRAPASGEPAGADGTETAGVKRLEQMTPSATEGEKLPAAENNRFALAVDPASGEFTLTDKQTTQEWHSNPPGWEDDEEAGGLPKTNMASQLWLTYVTERNAEEITNSHVGSRRKDGLTVWRLEDGFEAEYRFPDAKLVIPVTVRLHEGGITAAIDGKAIVEEGENRLYSLKLYPYFGAASPQDEGYMVVPDGSGVLIRHNNGKNHFPEYTQTLYGEDEAYEQTLKRYVTEQAYLPVFGSSRNDDGFVAIIEKGAEFGAVTAFVSGQYTRYNSVYAGFQLRNLYVYSIDGSNELKTYDKGPHGCDAIEISYFFQDTGKNTYSDMADTVRRRMIERYGLEEKEAGPALHLGLQGAGRQKGYVLGIPTEKNFALTAYEDAQDILDDLEAAGVSSPLVLYHNATRDAASGKIAGKRKASGTLGSGKQFAALTGSEYARVAFSDRFLTLEKSGNGAGKTMDSIRSLSDAIPRLYQYQLSTFYADKDKTAGYFLNVEKALSLAEKFVEKNPSPGGVGVGDLASRLYSDFSGSRLSRGHAADYIARILKTLAPTADFLAADGANDYAAPYLDYIYDVPQTGSRYMLCDEAVPFYQLVYAGLVGLSGPAANQQDDMRIAFLRSLESGSALYFDVFGSDEVDVTALLNHSAYSHRWSTLRDAVVEYTLERQRAAEIAGRSRLVAHEILDNGLVCATYENGAVFLINYTEEAVTHNGVTVQEHWYAGAS